MSNVARSLILPFAVGAALLCVAIPGCGDDSAPDAFNPANNGKKDGGSSGGDNNTICLLNNCDKDRDCADCSDGARVCLQSEHRCVACGPQAGGKTCASGQTCTKYGNCVGNGISCAEDAKGVPTITCKNTADCGACGPKFRVCDDATHKCVGCSDTNTTNCQSTDSCKAGTCTPKCPASCDTDDNCNDCGGPAAPAHACNKHICAECSPTKPCANGKACDVQHGKCVDSCGLGRPGVSNCSTDDSCTGCTATKKCDLPVNHTDGDPDGVCALQAEGCEDIAGKGIIVLPAPFNRVTNLCSDDSNCANQSLDVNIGKIVRDATGLDAVKDANLGFGMHACAQVQILKKSCGVCVPCKVDTDCQDIDLAQVGGDMFGPVGSIAASLLLDKAFGPNDHKIHMYCQNVAGDYGVCLPCGDVLHRCAQTADGLTDNGNCDHDICERGAALGLRCGAPSTCVADVCAKDPYCCLKEWDDQCKVDVDLYCSDKTCTPNQCAYRPAGWFCNTDPTQGGYKCLGDGKDPSGTTADGQQCAAGRKCLPKEANKPKSFATLCDTDGTDECPTGSIGKPKCVQ